MEPVLVAETISVSLSKKHSEKIEVVHNVSLQVYQREIVAIMGVSGSGKSTLLQAIAGLVPFRGRSAIRGQGVNELSQSARAAWRLHNLGFVFQSYNLQSYLTVLQNVMVPAVFAGISTKEATSRAHELLTKLGLGDKTERMIGALSGGEMQRVAIARALICSPAVILADEPTGNLDSKNADDVMKVLRQMCTEYRTAAIIVTHDQAIAQQCDRILTLADGVLRG